METTKEKETTKTKRKSAFVLADRAPRRTTRYAWSDLWNVAPCSNNGREALLNLMINIGTKPTRLGGGKKRGRNRTARSICKIPLTRGHGHVV